MDKHRIKQILHESEFDYAHTKPGANPEQNSYEIGENELFESELLQRVTEDGISFYKSLKQNKS